MFSKILLTVFSFFLVAICFAQDSLGAVEPQQSSYENKDLIMLALAAFGVLMAAYFLFRRAKKRRNG